MRTFDLKIPGAVFNDYLDPCLGTYAATEMAPYYGWRQQHGRGWSYIFKDVPEDLVRDLLDDLRNVAYCRSAGSDDPLDKRVGAAMRRVIERIEVLLA